MKAIEDRIKEFRISSLINLLLAICIGIQVSVGHYGFAAAVAFFSFMSEVMMLRRYLSMYADAQLDLQRFSTLLRSR